MAVGFYVFYFNDTATTEIYTLSLHDALPISPSAGGRLDREPGAASGTSTQNSERSEEHTSELQSQFHLVCRLLLEKKNSRSGCLCPVYAHGEPLKATSYMAVGFYVANYVNKQ